MSPQAFIFETEFTPAGDIVGGAEQRFFARADAEKMAEAAAQNAIRTVEATAASAAEAAMKRLSPTAQQINAIADQLRREAADLAMAAARAIAGAALDARGADVAAQAIEGVLINLKGKPQVVVGVAPDALPHVRQKLEALQRAGQLRDVQVIGDASARPGDWRVEWGEGATGFKAEDIEAAVRAAITARLADPVDVQADLFSAA
jgi:flagellar assembly protein FliH